MTEYNKYNILERASPMEGSRTARPRSILCSSGVLSRSVWSSRDLHMGSEGLEVEIEQRDNNCWQISEVRPTVERQGWEEVRTVRRTRRKMVIMVTSPGRLSRCGV